MAHGYWLRHTESWLASRRTHATSDGNHGISPLRCLWQLQCHRKVTAGETSRECEGGSTSPVHTVWVPSQGDRKAQGLHSQDPDPTREHLCCRSLSGCFHGFQLVPRPPQGLLASSSFLPCG
ncbi:uncharacterized protein LOC106731167 [Camelus ferus]|uniref:Uncharacterized protein LOC106731167 n=1 Tax=Camelus ferus TaxID=419612 RepID=A0A8B8T573_CAMFR|nr:uncharacterized protein LOC106731167 [Camelus ferus]